MPRLESEPRSIGAPQAGGRRRSKPKAATAAVPTAAALPTQPAGQPASDIWLICSGLVLLAGAWAYLPTLIEIVKAWIREPDYSHGFLVLPVAIFFLWVRRS